LTEGWAFIKRGFSAKGRKRHYYKNGKTKGLCGQKLSFEEKNQMVFIEKSEIMSTKVCPKCEILLCKCHCHTLGYLSNSIGVCDKCKMNHTVIKYVC